MNANIRDRQRDMVSGDACAWLAWPSTFWPRARSFFAGFLLMVTLAALLGGCQSEREAVREALAKEVLPLLDSHDDYVRRDPDLAITGALRHGRTQDGWLAWSAKIRAALDLIAPPRSGGGGNEPEPPVVEPPPIGPPVIEPGNAR